MTLIVSLTIWQNHSVLAFYVECELTIFGAYILGGAVIMLAALLDLRLAPLAFQAVVYWTVGMSVLWFADKARLAAGPRGTQRKSR